MGVNIGDTGLGFNLHTHISGRLLKAVNDGLGRVSGREHAAIGFGLEFDASAFEPVDGVGGIPAVEGADERAVASGVLSGELFGVETVVGDIAATTAGNFDFLKELVCQRLRRR